MPESIALLIFVTVQRAAELAWGRSNEAALRAKGAVEIGQDHYLLIVVLHATWLAWLWLEGWKRPLILPWVVLFVFLQAGRAWVLATLGRRWTTRVLVVHGESLVARGPFRLLRHPNYAVVALEIPVLPLAFGLWGAALGFGLINLSILFWRIHTEERALRPLREAKR